MSYRPVVFLHVWFEDSGEYHHEGEILAANPASRFAQIKPFDSPKVLSVPFSAIHSVALQEGGKVLQAFGRPLWGTPAWCNHLEVR